MEQSNLNFRISEIKTCDLVSELQKRTGVETHIAEPYKDVMLHVDGPAIVLTIFD